MKYRNVRRGTELGKNGERFLNHTIIRATQQKVTKERKGFIIPRRTTPRGVLPHDEPTTSTTLNSFQVLLEGASEEREEKEAQWDVKCFMHNQTVGLVALLEIKNIHYKVVQVATQKQFHMTFVYRYNQQKLRFQLWEDLRSFAVNMGDAWCVLGDFNVVLHPEERMGGETRTTGVVYTWTNKIVWPKINRVLANSQWAQECEYVHVTCKPEGLSDHTPLVLSFPSCLRKKTRFKYYEIWGNDPILQKIVQEHSHRQLYTLLRNIRGPLSRLHKDRTKNKENSIPKLLPVTDQTAKQASTAQPGGSFHKMFFFAKMKQRQLSSYVYSIQDEHDNEVEGFDKATFRSAARGPMVLVVLPWSTMVFLARVRCFLVPKFLCFSTVPFEFRRLLASNGKDSSRLFFPEYASSPYFSHSLNYMMFTAIVCLSQRTTTITGRQ
ncbi:hypothetical protein Cgig2_001811 [Carnegiea gigantea]|uniref:Uncharacterized protein n=1 Tax=Carnegiea gigantea TaxID=171969 RepID=A0A9Q1GST5_9CARY|nr:hypothetical protein Cgig2_001811 [Carnegiea gigantea]